MAKEIDILKKLDAETLLPVLKVDADLFKKAEDKINLDLDILENLDTLPVDTYVPFVKKEKQTVQFHPLLSSGSRRNDKLLKSMKKSGMHQVFVPKDQMGTLTDFFTQRTKDALDDPSVPDSTKARLLYDNARLLLTVAFDENRVQEGVKNAGEYVKMVTKFVKTSPDAATNLAAMLIIDYALYTHCINVCLLAISFGNYLKLKENDLAHLAMGSLYHDIGKIRIDETVLKKPGPLDDEEWKLMRKHPAMGLEILGPVKVFSSQAVGIVYYHHENLDGTGYPSGVKGDQVPELAKIIKILDCYDALTSKRWYKKAMVAFEAIKIIQKQMANHVSSVYLRQFVAFMGSLGEKSRYKRSVAI